jgi:hypothetical protein
MNGKKGQYLLSESQGQRSGQRRLFFTWIRKINGDLTGRYRIYQRTESAEFVSLPLGEGGRLCLTDEVYCTFNVQLLN